MIRRTWCALLLAMTFGGNAVAQNCSIPNNLANGTNADATQVMANFNALVGCVNGDTARQNALLDRIYLSKTYGGYRRVINAFADGYKAGDGIDSANSTNYTLNSAVGNVAPSSSFVVQAPSTVDTSFTFASGGAAQAQLYDGNDATPAADGNGLTTNTHAAYDFGTPKEIRRVRVITAPSSGFSNTAVFNIQYSDTSLTAGMTTADTITVNAGTAQLTVKDIASAGAHRYWRIMYASGTASGNAWLGELSFFTGIPANPMTLVTSAQTADGALSNARVLMEYDNSAFPTLNTDLTAEVTCDNGAHWATATLSSVSTHAQSNHYVAETADTTCFAGTVFAARIKTFNAKNIPIYGMSLSVH
ncbi:hypothetical protein ACM42_14320 [Bradyrhizobium sp. CCBAU 25338]|nr:hypothetical protein [Bradyrhizobium sp. CCBAU 25338]